MDKKLRQDLRRAYDRQVSNRDGRVIQPWKLTERAHFLDMLQAEGKSALLEVGAGTGQDSVFFMEQGLTVSCIDLSPENVANCRQKGLHAQVMDMCAMQFAPESFDAVFALNCLLHLPKNEFPVALAQVSTVLKENGLFYLGQYGGRDSEGPWAGDNYDPPRFFSFFTDDAMREAIEKIFEVERFKPINLGGETDELHFQSLTLRKRKDA